MRIENRLKAEIRTSNRESAAAERRPMEFVRTPATSLPSASAAAAPMATRSARIFAEVGSAAELMRSILAGRPVAARRSARERSAASVPPKVQQLGEVFDGDVSLS